MNKQKKTKTEEKVAEVIARFDLIEKIGIEVGKKCWWDGEKKEIKKITKNGLIKIEGVREFLIPADFLCF